MLGYDEEEKTTVLELTYNYGVTEYTKGNAYAQVMKHNSLFGCSFLFPSVKEQFPDRDYACVNTDCYRYR